MVYGSLQTSPGTYAATKYTQIGGSLYSAKKITNILKNWKLVHEIKQRGNATTSNFLPKRYVYDNGIAQDLRSLPFPEISILNTLQSAQRTSLRGLIENALYLNLLSSDKVYEITSWKEKSNLNKEIDFIVKSKNILPFSLFLQHQRDDILG